MTNNLENKFGEGISRKEYNLLKNQSKQKIIKWNYGPTGCDHDKTKREYHLLGYTLNKNLNIKNISDEEILEKTEIFFIEKKKYRAVYQEVGEACEVFKIGHSILGQLSSGQFRHFDPFQGDAYTYKGFECPISSESFKKYDYFIGKQKSSIFLEEIIEEMSKNQQRLNAISNKKDSLPSGNLHYSLNSSSGNIHRLWFYMGGTSRDTKRMNEMDKKIPLHVKECFKNEIIKSIKENPDYFSTEKDINQLLFGVKSQVLQKKLQEEEKRIKRANFKDNFFGRNKKTKYLSQDKNLRERLLRKKGFTFVTNKEGGIFNDREKYSIIDFILPENSGFSKIRKLSLEELAEKTKVILRKKETYNHITEGSEITINVWDYERIKNDLEDHWRDNVGRKTKIAHNKAIMRLKNFLYNINEDEFKQYKNQVNKELEILNKNNSPGDYYLYEAENKEK